MGNPFGNGAGAPKSGAASGARDFTREPARAQPKGDNGYNPAEVPPGGTQLVATPGAASSKDVGAGTPSVGRKPYKLGGGGAQVPAQSSSAPMAGVMPGEDDEG